MILTFTTTYNTFSVDILYFAKSYNHRSLSGSGWILPRKKAYLKRHFFESVILDPQNLTLRNNQVSGFLYFENLIARVMRNSKINFLFGIAPKIKKPSGIRRACYITRKFALTKELKQVFQNLLHIFNIGFDIKNIIRFQVFYLFFTL